MNKNVMIDLETLGLKPGSVVLSLGAVEFNPHGDTLGRQVEYHISLADSLSCGFTVDPGTLLWWLAQSEAARRSVIDGQGLSCQVQFALGQFSSWLGNDAIVWAWGDMDTAALNALYDKTGTKRPWNYRNVRDARTLVLSLVEEQTVRVSPTIEHNALSDAIAQAKTIQKLYKVLAYRLDT